MIQNSIKILQHTEAHVCVLVSEYETKMFIKVHFSLGASHYY